MTDDEYKAHVGKLCQDKDKPHVMYMVYELRLKNNHKGSCTPYYSYICLNTGHMSEAPCSHFFDDAAYVSWLAPNS